MSASIIAEQHASLIKQAIKKFPQHGQFPVAIVEVSTQMLFIYTKMRCIAEYPVSTSRFGTGQVQDSYKTPLGIHCVKEKIGSNADFAELFDARVRTHKYASIEHQPVSTDKECITTRILWLSGLEENFNLGGNVDSYRRYIYIHGTHEEGLIGQPVSQGCVRMKNEDVINLFEQLQINSLIIIKL